MYNACQQNRDPVFVRSSWDDDDNDDDRYHVHAFNEAIESDGEWENEEEKREAGRKRATGKGEEVLTKGNGLFLYSLALQGWFIDKVMIPWYVVKFNVLRT